MIKHYRAVGVDTCENTDCEGIEGKVKTVQLTEDFDNDLCDWCEACRKRDREMIKKLNK